jgi:hypothetical protein
VFTGHNVSDDDAAEGDLDVMASNAHMFSNMKIVSLSGVRLYDEGLYNLSELGNQGFTPDWGRLTKLNLTWVKDDGVYQDTAS